MSPQTEKPEPDPRDREVAPYHPEYHTYSTYNQPGN